jgi:type I restriction enzyme S subunit
MKNWEKKKLGDVCDFVRGPFGGSLKKNIFKPDGYAVYEQQHAIYDQFDDIRYFINEDKFNDMSRFELNPGDLIMSCSGTMGKIAIVPENIKKGIINQALLKLTPSKKILPVFLKLWMQSESFQDSLKEYSGGAAIQNVASVAILKQIEIPLPLIIEQQRIVAILDKAFAAIAKAKANAEQNLKNAKELFESYLQSMFENKAEGWGKKMLGDVCDLISKGSSPKWQGIKYVDQAGVLFVTSENVGENALLLNERKYVEEKFNIKEKKSILKNGDVLTNIVGASIGRTAIYDLEDLANINQAVCLIRTNQRVLFNEYLMYLLNSPFTKQHLHDNEINNARANLSLGFFRNLLIPLPELSEQKSVVNKIKLFHLEAQKLEAIYQTKINKLEELKKSILQKAFTGELTQAEVTS